MEFKQEHEKYSIEELELIINTQQDLYTEEEMNCLVDILSQKRETADIERINNLPKEIECPKCDMINPIENEKCQYCEFEFGSDKYQYAIDNIDDYGDDIFGYIEHDDETYDNETADIERINNLPKEIECPKCDMINPIENEKCQYCEFEFGSNKYQYAIDNIDDYDDDIFGYIEHEDETYDNESDDIVKDMFLFIIPLVVFILLAILILT